MVPVVCTVLFGRGYSPIVGSWSMEQMVNIILGMVRAVDQLSESKSLQIPPSSPTLQ